MPLLINKVRQFNRLNDRYTVDRVVAKHHIYLIAHWVHIYCDILHPFYKVYSIRAGAQQAHPSKLFLLADINDKITQALLRECCLRPSARKQENTMDCGRIFKQILGIAVLCSVLHVECLVAKRLVVANFIA